ncbi:MAG: tRNA uridine-5-carboxymethylaminomethyl(34) synthesis GTPase MnmE [Deltaproteobacteria bacterium]|nr:tRNA uridine-5-carboxymethylaminomethyl(34) synthesis GTPase MnmE [Deltaproteobacteria bacterium]
MNIPDNQDTIAAVATPAGTAGIGIIRISGPRAFAIAKRIFQGDAFAAVPLIPRHLYYGRIIDPLDNALLDDVLLACMPGPRSYTGEDVVEINCHGGLTCVGAVIKLVLSSGARTATPGEFTRRAFINGRLDLAQAEAVIDLIESRTEAGLKIAARQMNGMLSGHVRKVRTALVELCAHLEACIDFPEDDINLLTRESAERDLTRQCDCISEMIENARRSCCYSSGLDAVIAGKPNVGKSSIMNVLLGDERSIVTALPGTTRDVIRETITIAGVPVRLHDTAGIHSSNDAVETIGMDRALSHLASADITLLVFDGSRPLDVHDMMLLEKKQPGNCVAIVNKSDLEQRIDGDRLAGCFPPDMIVTVSAADHSGFDVLRARLARLVTSDSTPAVGDVIITSLRHTQALTCTLSALGRAREAVQSSRPFELVSADVQDALHCLGDITGETTSADILDAIFSRFCIGK